MDDSRPAAAYAAELIGTFLLVLFIALIVSVYGRVSVPEFAVIGLLHAFLLMMLIQALGAVSGAHFNPAVTLTLMSLRKIKPNHAGAYIAMQIVGAIAGAALAKLILHDMLPSGPNLGNVAVSPTLLRGKTLLGMLAEGTGTFALMWAIMGVAVNPRGVADWAGFVIGATLGFAVMVFAPMTGAGLNPARSLGPAIIAGEFIGGFGKFLLVYIVGPIIGALLAGFAYKSLVLDTQGKAGERTIDALP
jgi:MIP family channel proteins